MNEFELRRQLRGLPQQRLPQRDLFPEILARLPARRAARWPWAVAASLLLAAALPQLLLHGGDPAASAELRLDREARAMDAEYRAQLGPAGLPRELRPAARELDLSAQQLQAALLQQPQSPMLLRQLRKTLDQRLRLTQRVTFS